MLFKAFHNNSRNNIILIYIFSLLIWLRRKIPNAFNAMALGIFIYQRQVNAKTPKVNLLTRGKNRPVGEVISMTDSSLFMT